MKELLDCRYEVPSCFTNGKKKVFFELNLTFSKVFPLEKPTIVIIRKLEVWG